MEEIVVSLDSFVFSVHCLPWSETTRQCDYMSQLQETTQWGLLWDLGSHGILTFGNT